MFIAPPSSLVASCEVDEPPELKGPLEEQRKVLVEAWIDQTYNLHKCNVDKRSLQKWKTEQEEVFNGE